jgi:hypothetical protein
MIDGYFARVRQEGLTEHGFARLTSDIGVLIAHDRRTDLRPRFLSMMDFCCAAMPHVKAANDFTVREIVTCIMKDVTQSRQKKNHIRQVKLRTASMADEIVEKQMRIAHEIASLLGETVAETKVAVNDLKNTILMDEDKDEQR